MSRGGNKMEVVVLKCKECKNQNYQKILNKSNTPLPEVKLSKYCNTCKKHTEHTAKLESSGSKGLARNK